MKLGQGRVGSEIHRPTLGMNHPPIVLVHDQVSACLLRPVCLPEECMMNTSLILLQLPCLNLLPDC